MRPEDVAAWLKEHPEFFEQYAEMVADMHIPHPHGGRTIPISERQILSLRERSKQLEGKLSEIIQFGEENDAIGEKMHRMTLALMSARDLAGAINITHYHLREDFAVPHVVMRIWHANQQNLPEFAPVSDATKAFAASLTNPLCSAHVMVDTDGLFGGAAALLKSYAYLPLCSTECFGLVALASEDQHRFYPEMGTVFLSRLGDMIDAVLLRCLA
jgi:uncharacterized protein